MMFKKQQDSLMMHQSSNQQQGRGGAGLLSNDLPDSRINQARFEPLLNQVFINNSKSSHNSNISFLLSKTQSFLFVMIL